MVTKDSQLQITVFRSFIRIPQILALLILFAFSIPSTLATGGPSEELQSWQEEAKAGNAEAQHKLALAYSTGVGIAKSQEMAISWWKQSAEKGNANSQYELGRAYSTGRGVERDLQKAAKIWELSASNGNTDAEYDLACAIGEGQGIKRDHAKAHSMWSQLAAQGNPKGLYAMGNTLLYGLEPCKKDCKQGIELLRKSAELGFARAQLKLGLAYTDGMGAEKDLQTAEYWFNKALPQIRADAESGNPSAQ